MTKYGLESDSDQLNKGATVYDEENTPFLEVTSQKQTKRGRFRVKRNKLLLLIGNLILLGGFAWFSIRLICCNNSKIETEKTLQVSSDPYEEAPTTLYRGKNGGVASEQGSCSEIGVEILKQGGSAVDSAIATALCIGTVNGFSSGIGGGGFVLIRQPNGSSELVDFREAAPKAGNKTMYDKNPELSSIGGLSVAVPGEIRGFELIHKKYGKLPWPKLFEPAIKLCEEGFSAGVELVKQLREGEDWVLNNAEFSKIYAPNGRIVEIDQLVHRKEYGATLKRISELGSAAFYEGPIANEIVDFVSKNGGILTLDDLKEYQPIVREPAVGKFFNSTVITSTAPSSGAVLISTLELLETVIQRHGRGTNTELYHKFVECLKFGFALRTQLGDPQFHPNITSFSKKILNPEFINELADEVDLERTHNFPYYHPKYDTKELPGTTHISVIDSSGAVVSLTSTVNLIFGSRLMTPNSGIILNDEMDDFSVPNVSNGFNLYPSPLNWVQPGKRPLSSTVPTIVISPDGEILSLGGSGGSHILSAISQILFEIAVNGKDLKEAIDTPRIHHQLIPESVFLEKTFDANIIEGLEGKGHNVTKWPSHQSVVQMVKRLKNKHIEALSDGRKHGFAHVY